MSEQGATKQMEMPKHGEFCWTLIGTNDFGKCKDFYTSVFGWDFKKTEDYGTDCAYQEYSTSADGELCGGVYEITEEMFGEEMPPPHFLNYIAVDDVDETASKAFELGATIIKPPMDIPETGRMCIIQDPTGAMFTAITLTGGEK